MGYLICKKCKKYYKLQEGEVPTNFENKCNCGNTLRYVENLDIVSSDWKEAPITITCPKCGFKNPQNLNYCESCSSSLYKKDTYKRKTNKNETHNFISNILTFWNKLDKNHQYLIYASVILIFLIIAYRLALFSDINTGGNGENALITGLFLLAWIIPLFMGYKSKNKALKYGVILAMVYLITDTLILDLDTFTTISYGTPIEQLAIQDALNYGGVSYFPSIENILFVTIVFIILTFVGTVIAKRNVKEKNRSYNK